MFGNDTDVSGGWWAVAILVMVRIVVGIASRSWHDPRRRAIIGTPHAYLSTSIGDIYKPGIRFMILVFMLAIAASAREDGEWLHTHVHHVGWPGAQVVFLELWCKNRMSPHPSARWVDRLRWRWPCSASVAAGGWAVLTVGEVRVLAAADLMLCQGMLNVAIRGSAEWTGGRWGTPKAGVVTICVDVSAVVCLFIWMASAPYLWPWFDCTKGYEGEGPAPTTDMDWHGDNMKQVADGDRFL